MEAERGLFARAFLLPLCLAGLVGCSSQDFGSPSSVLTDVVDRHEPYVDREDEEDVAARAQRLARVLEAWQEQSPLADQDYSVGPDDGLVIGVLALDQPDQITTLNRTVSKDGTVDLPLVGGLRVAGLNARKIAAAVAALYDGKYLKNPQVTCDVADYKSAPVVITGAVSSPGMYYLRQNESSVLQVLAMAQGVSASAGEALMIVRSKKQPPEPVPAEDKGVEPPGTDLPVTNAPSSTGTEAPVDAEGTMADSAEEESGRKKGSLFGRLFGGGGDEEGASEDLEGTGSDPVEQPEAGNEETETVDAPTRGERQRRETQEVITVDLERLLDEGDIRMNVGVFGGDVISIPPRKEEYVYVLGYVQQPGAFAVPGEGALRALQAVAMAGGLSSSARAQNTLLITRSKRGEEVIPVDLTKITRGVRPPLYLEPGDTLMVGSSAIAKLAEFIKPTVSAGASVSPAP